MLKQRLLTAVILVPLLVWGIIALPTTYLAVLLGVVIAQGAWEWSGLMQMPRGSQRAVYLVTTIICIGMAGYALTLPTNNWLSLPGISLLWWLFATIWILRYPRNTKCWSRMAMQGMIGILILVPAWISVIALHDSGEQGPYWLLYLLSLIWVADSSAYFGGRRFGKHKLAPQVSPGKSWEGVLSALIATGFYALFAANWFHVSGNGNQWLVFVVLSMVTVMFSIMGDLAESMFKRHAGKKDSGNLLPGHGGVLDRIDSITAAAPVFLMGGWLGGLPVVGSPS
jgi:phosphatidate cytidylyltransferase